jgi:hypothetical protein
VTTLEHPPEQAPERPDEMEQYRTLMEVPTTFVDGFNWSSLVGAVFIALLMVPGAEYMALLAGTGVGEAAQWVTVILFIEVARRAHKTLAKPELFVLYYMAAAIMASPFSGLLYNQFYVTSNAAIGTGIADKIPNWYAPNNVDDLGRTFFDPAWYPAIGLILFSTIMGRLNGTILSYGLFRLASDVEKLPFPMAPIGAQGVTALAEQQSEEGRGATVTEGNWRWRVFSVGGVIGLIFGGVYTALPTISTAIFDSPIQILPIPWVDFTTKTGSFLPAVATGLSLDLGQVIVGMVLPFFAMVGSFIGLIMTIIANAFVLYPSGLLPSWERGDGTVKTMFSNNMDFYFSFSIGIAIAIALAGFYQLAKGLRQTSKRRQQEKLLRKTLDASAPVAAGKNSRGDLPTALVIGTYIFTASAYIAVSGFLIHWNPHVMFVLAFFAFIYTPVLAYVTARLEGMAGQVVDIPMVREAAFILSGYRGGVDIWFLPVPMPEDMRKTVFYRQAELTGTRFWAIWKSELILVPIVLVASICFANFIWSLAPIPGPQYPFAETMWEFNAANQAVVHSATLGRYSPFQDAINMKKLWIVGTGAGFGLLLFTMMSFLRLPVMLIYGLIRGLNQTLPHVVIPQFIGAMVGRFYFEKRLGLKWRQYVPVVAAGFACGVGLITVLGIGINFLAKAVIKINY